MQLGSVYPRQSNPGIDVTPVRLNYKEDNHLRNSSTFKRRAEFFYSKNGSHRMSNFHSVRDTDYD